MLPRWICQWFLVNLCFYDRADIARLRQCSKKPYNANLRTNLPNEDSLNFKSYRGLSRWRESKLRRYGGRLTKLVWCSFKSRTPFVWLQKNYPGAINTIKEAIKHASGACFSRNSCCFCLLPCVSFSLLHACPACPTCKEIKLEALVGLKHYSIAISFSTQLVRDRQVNNRILRLRATCFYHQVCSCQQLCCKRYRQRRIFPLAIDVCGCLHIFKLIPFLLCAVPQSCFVTQDKFEAALKHLQEILRRDPDDTAAKLIYKKVKNLSKTKDRGNQAFKRGQWQVAIDEYSAALLIDPELKKFNAKLYCNKAACLMKWVRTCRCVCHDQSMITAMPLL